MADREKRQDDTNKKNNPQTGKSGQGGQHQQSQEGSSQQGGQKSGSERENPGQKR